MTVLRELHPVDDATETGEPEELDLENKETAEFRVGDLFNVVTGSLVERDDLIEGDIPRVTASSDNNGVTLRISENVNGARYFSNIVTVSFLADSFYHPGVVSLEMKVHGISPKDNEFTLGSGLYVSAAIRKEISQKYGYGNQLSSSRIVNEHLSLPATPDGEPDWEWMDAYIRQIEERERELIDAYLTAKRKQS